MEKHGRYFVLRGNVGLSKQFVFVREVPAGLKTRAWKTGTPMVPPPVYTFVAKNKSNVLSDVLLTQFELPIFSPKAMAVLAEVGVTKIEYFPVRIEFGKGRVETSYAIGNVLSLVHCLDRARAKFTTFEDGDIMSLEHYRLVERRLGKKPPRLFRLGEFPAHVLAHESVKEAFDAHRVTGADFVRTERFG